MANNVRVTELDFDQIKSNLKDFLRAQSEFTDYDFDGSNMSVLMDLLAYNTHYNAVLANMVSNEMFLDTALKRSSVVSLAKNIGYTPESVRSARAVVNIALQNVTGSPNFITLNPYTAFTTNIDGTAYTFYNKDAYTTTPVNGVYTFSNVELYQGRKLDYFFTVSDATPASKYVIPNQNIDTTTLKVSVQYGGTGSYADTFVHSSEILNIDDQSKVYFLEENTQGFYEIYFGDNVIGVAPSVGDVIRLSYLISDGSAANVSTNISVGWQTSTIAGEISGDRIISTISKPSGGSDGDTIEDIRFYALKNYAAQNRAVTETDYASIIKQTIPGADSVIVWGGEKNTPPVYGKTYISIKPKTGYILTETEQARIITDVLQPRSIITADHIFVDPDYTYVAFSIDIKYNANKTSLSADQIKSLANSVVVEYMETNLNQFGSNYYKSQIEERLMHLDQSMISANVVHAVSKRFPLIPGVRFTAVNTFTVPIKIHPNGIRSSYFYFNDTNGIRTCQIRDVPDQTPPDYKGSGTLQTIDLNTGEIVDSYVGVVNYGTGVVNLSSENQLTIGGYLSNQTLLHVYFEVAETAGEMIPGFNEILVLDDGTADSIANIKPGVTINVIAANN